MNTSEEHLQWLSEYTTNSPLSSSGPEASFAEAIELMELFGNPQNAIPAIHIAGTMGKGTVAKLITNVLVAHGKTVVTLYSPHTYDQRERIELNSSAISEDHFVKLISKLKAQAPSRLTYFNAMVLMGFMYAVDQQADVVVVETGLGGRYDTTNTITRPDKLCVISKIGFDHMALLGTSLRQITSEKAGIITQASTVISYGDQDSEAREELTKHAELASANYVEALRYSADAGLHNPRLHGEFNRWNIGLALSAAREYLVEDFNEATAITTLSSFGLPGRFEVVTRDDITYIFDTAHNESELEGLRQTFTQAYGDAVPGLVYASSNPEHAQQGLALLLEWCGPIITTRYSEPTLDMWKPAVAVEHAGATNTNNTQRAAAAMSKHSTCKLWLITGSTYHLKQIKQHLDL